MCVEDLIAHSFEKPIKDGIELVLMMGLRERPSQQSLGRTKELSKIGIKLESFQNFVYEY